MEIGEVAPAATRNEDLFSRLVGVVNEEHPASALARREGAHHPRRARAKYDCVITVG